MELTSSITYNFTSAATPGNEDRFSVVFKTPGSTTAVRDELTETVSVFANTQGQIVMVAKEYSRFAVFGAAGQLIVSGVLKSGMMNTSGLSKGLYVVKINDVTKKVFIK